MLKRGKMGKLEREIRKIKICKNIGVIAIFIMGFLLVIGGIWLNKDIFLLEKDLKSILSQIDITKTKTYVEYLLPIFGIIVILIGFLSIFIVKKMNKMFEQQVEKYKKMNKWGHILTDYEVWPVIKYKSISLQLGHRYLYSFLKGLTIVEYREIKKVYAVKILGEDNEYIEIETKDNKRYRIASKPNNIKTTELIEAINIIQEKTKKMYFQDL